MWLALGSHAANKVIPAGSIAERNSGSKLWRPSVGGTVNERRTEITIETYEILIRSRRRLLNQAWCAGCGKRVAVVSLDDARESGLGIEALQRQVEAGQIHLIETIGGSSLICLDSLTESERRQP